MIVSNINIIQKWIGASAPIFYAKVNYSTLEIVNKEVNKIHNNKYIN